MPFPGRAAPWRPQLLKMLPRFGFRACASSPPPLLPALPPLSPLRLRSTSAAYLSSFAHLAHLTHLARSGTLVVLTRDAGARELPSPGPTGHVDANVGGFAEPGVIFLLGTAHGSAASCAAVSDLVRAVRPQAVVVELCRSRAFRLSEPDSASADPGGTSGRTTGKPCTGSPGAPARSPLTGGAAPPGPFALGGDAPGPGGYLASLARAFELGGPSGLLLRAFLAWRVAGAAVASPPSQGASLEPLPQPCEFLAASRAASSVGAEVVLGDRPLEITLERCWESLGGLHRAKALFYLGTTALATALQGHGPGSWGDDVDRAAVALRPREAPDEEGGLDLGATRARGRPLDSLDALNSDEAAAALSAALGRTFPELAGPLIHVSPKGASWHFEARGSRLLRAALSFLHHPHSRPCVPFLPGFPGLPSRIVPLRSRWVLGPGSPRLLDSLGQERDAFLAWSLKRSKAVRGAQSVVGVVGRGHLRGIAEAILADSGGDRLKFEAVAGRRLRGGLEVDASPGPPRSSRLSRALLAFLVEGAALGVGWEAGSQAARLLGYCLID